MIYSANQQSDDNQQQCEQLKNQTAMT